MTPRHHHWCRRSDQQFTETLQELQTLTAVGLFAAAFAIGFLIVAGILIARFA